MSRKPIGSGMLMHVPQRTEHDCAIATAANIANVPYEVAADRSPVKMGTRGLYPLEIVHLLESLTGVRWRVRFGWLQPLFKFADSACPVALLARKPWTRRIRHYVAAWGGMVFDPELKDGCPQEDYSRRRWRVLQMFHPADPGSLVAARRDRHWLRCVGSD